MSTTVHLGLGTIIALFSANQVIDFRICRDENTNEFTIIAKKGYEEFKATARTIERAFADVLDIMTAHYGKSWKRIGER